MDNKNTHILIIRLSAMGDVAMTVPVIRALLMQHNNLKITIVTRPFFTPFFSEFSNVTIYTPDLKGKHQGIRGIYRLFLELKALNIDAVADLHAVLRSTILVSFFKFAGIKCSVLDKGRKEKKKLLASNPNKVIYQLQSMHNRYASVFSKLGYPLDLKKKVTIKKHLLPNFVKKEIPQEKLIGFAPFAAYPSKSLPLHKLEEVLQALQKETNTGILLFGGGAREKEILNALANKYSNVFSMVGKGSFAEELQVIANLKVMIAMDSGNGHIAAMHAVPVLTIWGVTHPYLGYTPFQQPMTNQILPDLQKFPLIPTSTYGKKYPEEYLQCFETIDSKEIIKKINKYI